MTGMWMFLLVNDYGLIGYGMQLLFLFISIFLLCLCFSAIDKFPLFALIIFVMTIFFWHGLYVVSPSKIPNYGTKSQKSKMAYCMQQYMQTEHVGLETITNENLESIMIKCQKQEEEQLKNEELQNGIHKVINENK